jgi:hypothetical protein
LQVGALFIALLWYLSAPCPDNAGDPQWPSYAMIFVT